MRTLSKDGPGSEFAKNLGLRIRAYRKESGFTGKDLSKAIGGGSDNLICRYEKGEISPPLEKAVKLASIFNITLDELAGIKPRKTRTSDAASDLEARLAEMERRLSALEEKQ